jgi:progressive ankylosis protein
VKTSLTNRQIFIFWFPLALSWLIMSVEGPFVAAVMARLAEAKYNLAAHGVAFSFALIFEAPIISITAATTALCKDAESYRKLNRFVSILNFSITGLMILMLVPPVFSFIMLDLIGLPAKVAGLTHIALIILIPWPMSIGYRRFYQGVLITRGLTRRITYGTLVRLSAMTTTASVLFYYDTVGAYMGAAALVAGVISELIAVRLMTRKSIIELKQIESTPGETEQVLSFRSMVSFYYPLALMTILGLGVHPMVTFFMGKGRFPLESLAVLPVVNAFLFLFRSVGLSYQEAVIALLRQNSANLDKLRSFGVWVGIFLIAGFMLVAFTPLSAIWFHSVSGLDLHLTGFALLPVKILAILPGMAVLVTFQWGVLVHGGKTSPISMATMAEVATILLVLSLLIGFFDMTGIIAAAIAFLSGTIVGNLYLLRFTKRQILKIKSAASS